MNHFWQRNEGSDDEAGVTRREFLSSSTGTLAALTALGVLGVAGVASADKVKRRRRNPRPTPTPPIYPRKRIRRTKEK